jgi:acyl dehydratase
MSAPFVVGQLLDPQTVHMTHDRVVRYAAASGDDNPIHLDEVAAVEAGLPGRIVHGMLTMGMFGTAASEWAGGATNIRAVSCRFRALVMIGDVVTISGVVARVEGDVVTVEASIVNQRQEPVLSSASVVFAL